MRQVDLIASQQAQLRRPHVAFRSSLISFGAGTRVTAARPLIDLPVKLPV
jgi:hypothetical protein